MREGRSADAIREGGIDLSFFAARRFICPFCGRVFGIDDFAVLGFPFDFSFGLFNPFLFGFCPCRKRRRFFCDNFF